MKVFEFHFNPKIKLDLIFDSFCYEPENIYEKKMGSLYMAGILRNALPKNSRFIENLVKVIKDKYYRSTIFTPEKSLKESLKVANEFLDKITKRGDVSWLGKLGFTVISLSNFKMNFAKVGNIKILLIRGKRIIDIDEKVRFQDMEPYPLKVFGNTVSGKLAKGDILLVLTKDIFDFFKSENLLKEIANLESFNEKSLREIINGKEELLVNISGIFLTIVLTKEVSVRQKETISPKALKEFSLKEVFSPVLALLKKAKPLPQRKKVLAKKAAPSVAKKRRFPGFSPQEFFSTFLSKAKKPSVNLAKFKKKLKLPEIKPPQILVAFFNKKVKPLFSNKKLTLTLALTIVLIFGFTLSKSEKEKRIKIYTEELQGMKEKLEVVDSLLLLQETSSKASQKANLLLKESWEEITLLSKNVTGLPNDFTTSVYTLRNEISEKLSDLNKLEKIKNPEPIHEFERKTFIPHNILVSEGILYFFSPYEENISKRTEGGQISIIETNKKINLATELEDGISFFKKPNQLIILRENELISFSLQDINLDFNFDNLASFKNSLYFLDKKTGQIIKYPYLGNLNWGSPQLWLNPKTAKVKEADSMSIDGSIWILRQNSIYKYHGGHFQKEINLEIFPTPKDFSKIFTSPTLPYIYILEPSEKRVIVIGETGDVIKQFQSEEFDNLLDFAVSENGKTIYLLNGLKVYKIEY